MARRRMTGTKKPRARKGRRTTRRRNVSRRMTIPRNISVGTRYTDLYLTSTDKLMNNANLQFFIPLYNLLNIAQGNLFNQRTGSSIYIHKIHMQISIFPDIQKTAIYENEIPLNTGVTETKYLEDPRVRVIMVNQKRMASIMPIDGNSPPIFPYYASSATSNYAQLLSLPLAATNDSGMIGKVDDRNFMIRSDTMYNLLQNSSYPILNIDQVINVREQYQYPLDSTASVADLTLNDTTLWYKIPQCWVYLPQQVNTSTGRWKIKIYMKAIYDSI